MKNPFILIMAFAFATALAAFRLRDGFSRPAYAPAVKSSPVIRCGPDWAALRDWLEESDIPPIPGAGTYQWKISTARDSAQFYFNQGINMYYGFHIIEAMASFKKAQRFDPACAMIYWAQALAYGPNINDYGYRASPEALEAVKMANAKAAGASPFERDLITAMSVRYTGDSTDVSRSQLNQAYTAAMKTVATRYPAQADALALYADAMMLEHPWDLWQNNGTPRPWTPAIRQVLEKLLAGHPAHPGANHYYIHVMEASPYADRALPSAARLGLTNPALSHLVHMPSHIYIRTGNYQLGVSVNTTAVESYETVLRRYPAASGADFLYLIHNLHMKANNAMLGGHADMAHLAAMDARKSIPSDYLQIPGPMGNYIQYIYMTPVFGWVRFGNWEELLRMSQPAPSMTYANVIYHFGKGMALARMEKPGDAEAELEALRSLMKDPSLTEPMHPFSAAIEGAKVAEHLLAGTVALAKKNTEGAIQAFRLAVTAEENMVYNEPRDWMLSPKHYLADALLKESHYREAREVLQRDLRTNAENGWALAGIAQALQGEKKKPESAKAMTRCRKAFAGAEKIPPGPVF